jgi:chromosomal replication initiator protein
MTTPRASRRTPPDRAAKGLFHGFLTLPENRSGLLAVRRLARHLRGDDFGRKRFPPVFLHGDPGSGKTHLFQALLAQLSGENSDRSILVVPAVEVSAEFLRLPDGVATLVGEWRSVDLLLIEDVQFLSPHATESLANLLDHRQSHGRCTVFCAVPGPAELNFPNRLASRLANGLVVHLEGLSLESRKRFVEHHAAAKKLRLSPEVVEWTVRRGPSVRELLGELHRLETLAKMYPPPLSLEAATSEPTAGETESKPEALVRRVAEHFEIPVKQLKSKARHRSVLWPRQVAIYLLREMLGLSLVRIGSLFGGKDHTTVMHAIEKVKAVLGEDAGTAQEIRKLRAVLQ